MVVCTRYTPYVYVPEAFASFHLCHCVLTTSPEVTLDDQANLRSVDFISCLSLDSHQAGSFLLPSSSGPNCKSNLSTPQRKHLHTKLIPVRSELTQNGTQETFYGLTFIKPGS
ncbi:hypothetical protein ILYODFUR_032803 [Ilyodon furcidens]|uniref:Uncharacterized protein n=1 Tax=Ilyodon furcidens TaxID=33524 RepID=A0ABV0SR28_9TELE